MTPFPELIQQGAANAWLFIPSALLLGALHGLEPGHSKTMMAAFIVAIRGSVWQALLLGLSATLSHTAVVWIIALAGLHFGEVLDVEASEPWFQLASAGIMLGVAVWMIWRVWRDGQHRAAHDHHHDHDHHHPHEHDHDHDHDDLDPVFRDAHEQAHAADIQRRFAGRDASTGQIVLFGLTGGLIPCPASITVLLLCLQLKQVALGLTLVLCFSLGLAATMVSVGVVAALGVRHAGKRWAGAFEGLARRAPYVSGVLILAVALAVAWQAVAALL